MGKLTEAAMKQQVIDGFVFRKQNPPTSVFGKPGEGSELVIPTNIDNSKLHAGSAMIYYCMDCGWPSDIKHETHFLHNPRKRCAECKMINKNGWMKAAHRAADALMETAGV